MAFLKARELSNFPIAGEAGIDRISNNICKGGVLYDLQSYVRSNINYEEIKEAVNSIPFYVECLLLSSICCHPLCYLPDRNPSRFSNGSWTRVYWPVRSPLRKEFLTLNAANLSVGYGLASRRCAFWNNYLPKLLLGQY
jgi:hypothetical protein